MWGAEENLCWCVTLVGVILQPIGEAWVCDFLHPAVTRDCHMIRPEEHLVFRNFPNGSSFGCSVNWSSTHLQSAFSHVGLLKSFTYCLTLQPLKTCKHIQASQLCPSGSLLWVKTGFFCQSSFTPGCPSIKADKSMGKLITWNAGFWCSVQLLQMTGLSV